MSGWKSSTHHPLTVRLVKLAAQRMQGRPDALGDFTVAVDHGGGCFSIELHMLESLENPLMNLPVNRHDETFNRWIDEWFRDYLSAEPAPEPTAQAEPVAAVVPGVAQPMDNDEWRELAQSLARKIIKRQSLSELYPSQVDIADEIAADFRQRRPPIHGADGKPLSGASIKRWALKGISSATKKMRATRNNRGK